MKTLNRYCLLFFVLGLAAGCAPVKDLSFRNLSYLYSEEQYVAVNTAVYRVGDMTSRVYFDFEPLDDILIPDISDTLEVAWKLYPSYEKATLLGSDTIELRKTKDAYPLFDFDVKLPGKEKYLLEMMIKEKEKLVFHEFVDLNASSSTGRQNFKILNSDDEFVLKRCFGKDEPVSIQSNDHQLSRLTAYHYSRKFPIALPPFVYKKRDAFKYAPDSVFVVKMADGQTPEFIPENPGFYHFLADTSQRNGLTVFRFYDGFPGINSPKRMLYPLRYLTTKEEFGEMAESENKKLAVEQFWLKLKGNAERAAHSIKKYYSRVERANRLFTSYIEGWKTDRGMVYIIFGVPGTMKRGDGYEIWKYGEPHKGRSLEFTFVRVDNPFTDNDFKLIKSPGYKEPWYYAVDNWRR